jgi:membrane fusion protein (multidrug efflux system)
VANLRIGQPVLMTADVYGRRVPFHGKVVGFNPGTGSAFALLPAQNATGNWIKIVQRVPVRVAFDPRELAAHPLQIGLSMQVSVDTHNAGGERLPQLSEGARPYQTDVFTSIESLAGKQIQSIIAANAAQTARPEPIPGVRDLVEPDQFAGLGRPVPAE